MEMKVKKEAPSILIVDDEALVRELLVHYLKSDESFQIDEAAGGLSAISKSILNKFDLVILDLAMPDFNGMETMKNIRINCPDLKFIIITGMTDSDLYEQCQNLGCQLISKPIEKKVLLDAVYSSLKMKSSSLLREETIRGRGI
jgi:CheY-like chemotaxis protein